MKGDGDVMVGQRAPRNMAGDQIGHPRVARGLQIVRKALFRILSVGGDGGEKGVVESAKGDSGVSLGGPPPLEQWREGRSPEFDNGNLAEPPKVGFKSRI